MSSRLPGLQSKPRRLQFELLESRQLLASDALGLSSSVRASLLLQSSDSTSVADAPTGSTFTSAANLVGTAQTVPTADLAVPPAAIAPASYALAIEPTDPTDSPSLIND